MLAATDTSTTTNEWAMTEILRHPHIQQKLHAELDAVVGRDRIVQESDMPHFPYLASIVKETLRLHPANSFTLPRLSMADAELAGYHIPKGSTVLINLFSLGRDENVWPRPLEFDPERWAPTVPHHSNGKIGNVPNHSNGKSSNDKSSSVASSVASNGLTDERMYVFGNGRRACPGYVLGSTLVLLSLARLFHGFEWQFPDGVRAEDVDMAEAPGFSNARRCRLMAVATPRLAPHLYGGS